MYQYSSGFNTDVAMRKAKNNVEKHYAVVGVLEDFNKTFAVLEHYLPKIFKGSLAMYQGKKINYMIIFKVTSKTYI